VVDAPARRAGASPRQPLDHLLVADVEQQRAGHREPSRPSRASSALAWGAVRGAVQDEAAGRVGLAQAGAHDLADQRIVDELAALRWPR
jgi:hypothetical protein